MQKHLKFGALAAAVAVAGLASSPTWAQGTTSAITAPNAASGVNGDTRGDRLRTDCFDRTTQTWRSTSECVALHGTGALTGGSSSGTAGAGASTGSSVLGNSGGVGSTGVVGASGSTAPRTGSTSGNSTTTSPAGTTASGVSSGR